MDQNSDPNTTTIYCGIDHGFDDRTCITIYDMAMKVISVNEISGTLTVIFDQSDQIKKPRKKIAQWKTEKNRYWKI